MTKTDVVTGQEWRWVLIVGVAALVVTSIPYLIGWQQETPERVFEGCILLIDDCYSYLAKMRQGAEGAWLFHIAYTPESHLSTFFFPFHLALGKVATLLPGSVSDLTTRMIWIYHGSRVVFGMAFLLTVYRFLSVFTAQAKVRRWAWLMVTFGGGLGWLLVMLGRTNWLGTPPLDFYLPEGFALLVLYGFPHIAAAQSLLLWGILCLLRAWQVCPTSDVQGQQSEAQRLEHATHNAQYALHIQELKWAMLAGLLWLAMGVIVPFYVAVTWAVMAAAWLGQGIRERRVGWRKGLVAGGAVFASAPIVLYSAWVFTSDPVYVIWAAQNLILSPHPLHYLAAYGIPLALAAFAVRDVWYDEGPAWLALAWVVLVPVLIYLPFNLQRRLVNGVQVPLSLLAAWGAMRLWRSGKRWLVALSLATMVPTGFILLAGSSAMMFARPPIIFRDAAEIAALDWMSERVRSDDVVLAAYETGNYLPARMVARAFLGHGLETVDVGEKETAVARFFGAGASDAWRQRLLAQYGIDYVFWGPWERQLGAFDLRTAPYLREVYQAEGYAIFEVRR